MKIAIAYAGKTGTTKKCAELLKQKLPQVDTYDLTIQKIDISSYDFIIIGGSIRIGMFHKKIKELIHNHKEILKNKQIAFYFCCAFSENIEQYVQVNIPEELQKVTVICSSFGGELDINKQKGFEKWVVKMVSKDNHQKVEINELKIEEFVEKVKEVIK